MVRCVLSRLLKRNVRKIIGFIKDLPKAVDEEFVRKWKSGIFCTLPRHSADKELFSLQPATVTCTLEHACLTRSCSNCLGVTVVECVSTADTTQQEDTVTTVRKASTKILPRTLHTEESANVSLLTYFCVCVGVAASIFTCRTKRQWVHGRK